MKELKNVRIRHPNFTSYIKRIYTKGFLMISGGIEVN